MLLLSYCKEYLIVFMWSVALTGPYSWTPTQFDDNTRQMAAIVFLAIRLCDA